MEKKVYFTCIDSSAGRIIHELLSERFGSIGYSRENGYVSCIYYCGIQDIRRLLRFMVKRGLFVPMSYRINKLY